MTGGRRARARARRRWKRSAAGALDAALRADRRRQLGELLAGPDSYRHRSALLAWSWWGWHIGRPGGLGYPGLELGERERR